jgi:glutaminase
MMSTMHDLAAPATADPTPGPTAGHADNPPAPAGGGAAASSPIQACLQNLHRRFTDARAGSVATYIPELAKADPNQFAIVIATVDGKVYEVGDSRARFTIQSISKPLVYGAALEDQGSERVLKAIGVEPTGDAFNSISLEPGTGRPLNPMINAGAIAATSLIAGATADARWDRILAALSAYAGRRLDVDDAVFESERTTGHRNRAIGHLLRNYDIVREDPEPALDLYFRQCSVRIDCRDLALIGATLANAGVNPVTGQRALASEHVRAVLSVMTTCGMYDFTGEWVYRVGMPAKSGVGGGIMAVLPGQLGIGVFSPALDERGNSVRGVKVCEALSGEFGLHMLLAPGASGGTVRAHYTLADVRSKRRRSIAERRALDEQGHAVSVYELQGDLRFASIEQVIRRVIDERDSVRFVVLDFKHVLQADAAATQLLARLVERCARRSQQVLLTRVRRDGLLDGFGSELDPRHARAASFQPQLDRALEWCENQVLAAAGVDRSRVAASTLAGNRLCEGLDAHDIEFLQSQGRPHRFEPGSLIVRRGDPADAVYLLLQGEASVVVDLSNGGVKRLSTLSAGMSFGEPAFNEGGVRTADIRADTLVDCLALDRPLLARLSAERPSLMVRLLRNALRESIDTASRLTVEVAALEGKPLD